MRQILKENIFFRGKEQKQVSKEKEDDLKKELSECQSRPFEGEIEKSPEWSEKIDWLTEKIREIAAEYGVEPFNLTADIVHFLPEEKLRAYVKRPLHENIYGTHTNRGILLNEKFFKTVDIDSLIAVIHELFHQASITKLAYLEDEEKKFDFYAGLSVKRGGYADLSKTEMCFGGLNETITQYLTKKFYRDHIQNQEEGAAKEKEIPGPRGYDYLERLLDDLAEKLREVNQDKYQDKDEVIKEMVKSYFSGGSLLPLFAILNPHSYLDISRLKPDDSLETLKQIAAFREKYGLPEDEILTGRIEYSEKGLLKEKI
ncbi:MAG: hypothetical protein AAB358_01810 [Patescibacteria group bacterium]